MRTRSRSPANASSWSAAATVAEESDAIVDLSYRGDAFARAKAKNRSRVDAAIASGRLTVRLSLQIVSITRPAVTLKTTSGPIELPNYAIIVCAGGVLPTDFLKLLGITTTTKFGQT